MTTHSVSGEISIPVSACLNCGELNDVCNAIDNDQTGPSPGNVTVCLYCGHLMAFADDLSMRPLTDDEMIAVAGNESVLAVQRARGEIDL